MNRHNLGAALQCERAFLSRLKKLGTHESPNLQRHGSVRRIFWLVEVN